jgi:hypothetical protein
MQNGSLLRAVSSVTSGTKGTAAHRVADRTKSSVSGVLGRAYAAQPTV